MSRALAEKRAARGAAWLDKVLPGWAKKIRLSTLELNDGKRCVLGQLAPTFAAVCPDVAAMVERYGSDPKDEGYSLVIDGTDMSERTAVARGFECPTVPRRISRRFEVSGRFDSFDEWTQRAYAELDDAWKSEIRARR